MNASLPSLLQDVLDNALRYPDKTAIAASDGELRYGELAAEIEAAARGLVHLGVRPGDRVALIGHKTVSSVVAIFAIMRVGAAYVPLDPRAPLSRQLSLIEDAACPVVLTGAAGDTQLVQRLHRSSALSIDVMELPGHDDPLPESVQESSVAVCLYTSGSTGRPKGVQLTFDSIAAFQDGFNELVPMTSDSRCLNVAALHFDVSMFDVLLPLRVGAQTWLGPLLPVAEIILDLIQRHGITHTSSVGSTMTLLANESHDFEGYDLSSLRALLTGAEVINPRTVQRWLTAAADLAVINAYGPCEATCSVINHSITKREPGRTELYPIGLPAPRTRILLRGEDGRIDEHGPGEILVGGAQVMLGYLNRPEEEAAAFTWVDGERYYRTGDWGRRRPDGVYLIAGRRDDEIKIHGQRVNLNEVARTIEAFGDVRNAFVSAVRFGFERPRLLCAVVHADVSGDRPAHGSRLAVMEPSEEKALREYLAGRLPQYMHPHEYFVTRELPVLSSGKPDAPMIRSLLRSASEGASREHGD